jgi:hypothetical protein
MSERSRRSACRAAAVLAAVVTVGFGGRPAHAQQAAPKGGAAKPFSPAKTPDGQPDLQGIWGYATITPLERPSELAGKQTFSDEEAASFERDTLAKRDNDRRDDDPTRTPAVVNGQKATADVARAYNQFWWDYGTKVVGTKRTSLVVDPSDGRIPALTPKAAERAEARRMAAERTASGPEDRGLGERCINWGVAGPPMRPGAYNNNVQLLQTRDHVVILNEMIHDARVVPLDGRPHGKLRQWQGDSRGHFEGNTLVVETVNFTDQTSFNGSDENMKLIERFTKVDPETLLYEFTIDNPTAFTKPFTVQIPMSKSPLPMFEYACHEGNYGMYGILSGARALDRAAAEATKKGSR